ncbi:hypothetical protein H8N03_16230 [Ramlibacter sp. USB13]|uniref:Uncharacterized protein n=1 Tax=Ramlibacter cellulosilyticus TaxID=2764187 RepID=A0A923SG21_9BURK|nr:hypothetical protein [Ramlibacter cellulosilyticus]MBC5784497.1 hypothetical protein [Ramlibacter cellulosilyticus]
MAAEDDRLLPLIRERVKEGLTSSAAFARLPPAQRAKVANDTVRAFHYILGGADGRTRPDAVTLAGRTPVAAMADKPPLPEGDTAGSRFAQSGAVAAQQGSTAFTEMIQKVDFPQFVAGLIDGVFNAIVHSSIQQMEAYAELVKNVSKSVDQYMKDNVSENNARDYLADRYPEHFEIDISGDKPRVRKRQGSNDENLPDLQGDLGLPEPVTSVDDDEIEGKLVPAARRRMALDRQQLLATMVMMGVNRLVVTNGTIEASCMFELNTTDAVKRRMRQERSADWHSQNKSEHGYEGDYSRESSGFLGLGAKKKLNQSWYGKSTHDDSANFSVTTSRSEDSDAKVQMHAKLAGKVNVQFKSDYFPMERMVDVMQIQAIRGKTPEGATPPAGATPVGALPAPKQPVALR